MKLPVDLSGHALIAALCRDWGYVKVHQADSHIVLQTQQPTPHRVSIPAHKTLRVGTLNGILRSVANHKGIERQEILELPYSFLPDVGAFVSDVGAFVRSVRL